MALDDLGLMPFVPGAAHEEQIEKKSTIQHEKEENEKVQQQLLEIQIQVNVVNSAVCKSNTRRVDGKENASVVQRPRDEGVIDRWCMYQQQLVQLSHNLHTVQTEGSHHQRFLNYAHSRTHTNRDVPYLYTGNDQEQEVLQLVLEQNAFQERNCHLKEEIQNSINRALRQLSKMMQTVTDTADCCNKKTTLAERDVKTPLADKGNMKTPLVDRGNMKTPLADRGNMKTPLADKGNMKTPLADRGNMKTPLVDRGNMKTPLADRGNMKTPLADRGNMKTPLAAGCGVKTSLADSGNKM